MVSDQAVVQSQARDASNHNDKRTSAEKKRARDRRAQQNLRDKRSAHVKILEERIEALQDEMQRLQLACKCFRRTHSTNLPLQDGVKAVTSCAGNPAQQPYSRDSEAPPSFHLAHNGNSRSPNATTSRSSEASVLSAEQSMRDDPNDSVARILESGFSSKHVLPQWNMIPAHCDTDVVVTDCFSQWLHRPDLVAVSPEAPLPIELLFGSKRNFLANLIHQSTKSWPCRDPERLAGGWLAYHFIKWLVRPSETRFSRLQNFQKPIAEQLCYPHPYFVDFVIWPKLRANIINNLETHVFAEVLGMLTCCLKVRWPWNEPILEPDDEGNLQMRADFYNTFTRTDGWGLAEQFMDKYPALIDGLDIPSIQYTFM